jgi:UDP-N-acetyl-D-mannosaminuronate dehydrogenase
MTPIKSRYLINDRKIVIFGAGKVGRSFIGQIFSRSGFEVVFVDVDKKLISNLNLQKQYKVIFKDNTGDDVLYIRNVRGVHLNDSGQVIRELASATLAALCVGQQGLPDAIPVIARALVLRLLQLSQRICVIPISTCMGSFTGTCHRIIHSMSLWDLWRQA